MMIVITFVVPMFILMFFRWLLTELFSLHLDISVPQMKDTYIVKRISEKMDKVNHEDFIALKMVKKVYEPVIKAIDSDYNVYVEFK